MAPVECLAEDIDFIALDISEHFAIIPVRVNDTIAARMIFDSGIGLSVISRELSQQAHCPIVEEYVGRRMSGQRIAVPVAHLAALTVATRRAEQVPVGIIDAGRMIPPGVDGILSVGFFERIPFTTDYRAETLILESRASLAQRQATGDIVRLEVQKDGPSLTLFMLLEFFNGLRAKVKIDTGSDSLILDEPYMSLLGIDPRSPSVRTTSGEDETSYGYTRYFASILGPVFPADAPQMRQSNPGLMFQKIIYDGLVGYSFLKNFIVTYNLPESQIILARM